LTAEKRSGWRQTARGAKEAESLWQKAQYGKALPLKQEYVKWCRQVLGEDHPDTATSYNDVAFNLNAQGKYAEAGPLHHKALDLRRKILGEEHPSTAASYNNLAVNLYDQGKYAEAGPLFQKALDIWRKTLGEEHADTARGYNNLATILDDQGKHAEAGPLHHKALDLRRKILGEEHPDTAESYILKPLQFFLFAPHLASVPALPPPMRWPSGRMRPDTAQEAPGATPRPPPPDTDGLRKRSPLSRSGRS
jgi:tetratricopeptide (TPR) repeat protein